ncbi:histidine--tRNA ligase [Pelagibacteraceae bacterium]|nr:histidine--tRNA ligase [Pelagibacteraceae bacterium]
MKKEKKIKPSKELPLGFVDRQEKELLTRDFIISNIKEVMIKYGFQYLETPSFEYTDSIGKFLPDKERPDQGVFSFKDEKNWLSLRYDLTAPLARYIAKNYLEIPKPFKRYQLGTVWRNEKPGPGRYREFLQFDADYVGTKNLQADAELCVLISEILEKCGLTKEDYIVKISSRKFTKDLFDELKIKSEEQSVVTLRALDKIDRLGWEEVKKILGKGREDKSGDYTKGAELNEKQIEVLEKRIKDTKPKTDDILEIMKIFEAYEFTNYKYDPSVIRGLEYYTGPIFEVNLNFEVKNFKGKTIQFGSIGGGGRYDNLVSNFGSLDCPSTGISIGIDRLVYALMQKKEFNIKSNKPVVICVFSKENINDYVKILKKLREANISCEIYPGESNLKKQMQYANKIGSPAVILYGEDEIKSGKPTLRDLKSGKESNTEIENLSNEIKKIL